MDILRGSRLHVDHVWSDIPLPRVDTGVTRNTTTNDTEAIAMMGLFFCYLGLLVRVVISILFFVDRCDVA